jgi:hypothetical protein
MFKKFIPAASALAVVAALAIPAVSMANVAVTNGVGTVDKGDVMSLYNMNESTFQSNVSGISFTHNVGSSVRYFWTCSDGSTQAMTLTEPATQTVNYSQIINQSAHKTTGWNMAGYGATTNGTPTLTGAPFFSCPDGTTRTSGLQSDLPVYNDVLQVTYNGITKDLPNTPIS